MVKSRSRDENQEVLVDTTEDGLTKMEVIFEIRQLLQNLQRFRSKGEPVSD